MVSPSVDTLSATSSHSSALLVASAIGETICIAPLRIILGVPSRDCNPGRIIAGEAVMEPLREFSLEMFLMLPSSTA